MARKTKDIEDFKYGLVTKLEKKSIPAGAAGSMLNFRTKGDKIEQRRGYRLLGEDTADTARCNGVHAGERVDGTEVLFRKRGRKLEYYNETTELWVEIGSDLFPALAETDEASFVNYESPAGAIVYVTSPNSGIYKIMTANPGDYSDMQSTTYRGHMIIHKNRSWLWDRRDTNYQQDRTSVYLSWIDNENYTTVNAEAVGALGATAYTYTLAFRSGSSKRTCFGIVIKIGGTVKLADDFNGGLVHVDGASAGSGTVNYTTGVITITLSVAASGNVTADYQWEDSTDEGVLDFSYSGTRAAGEGDVLPQGEGGPIMSIEAYNDQYFVFHQKSIYRVILSADDLDADNNVFRRGLGTASFRSTSTGANGIYFLDFATDNSPQIRELTTTKDSVDVVPISRSRQLDLTGYTFDECYMKRQGETLVVGCKSSDAEENNRMFIYDEIIKSWDVADIFGTSGTIYNGVLVVGDSLSGNVYEVFSGFDDNDSVIPAHYEFNKWDLDYPDQLKKTKTLVFEGDIAVTQFYDVKIALEDGSYVTIGQIAGTGTYVDRSQPSLVGPTTIGRSEIGGGSDGVNAYHYYREISLRGVDKFDKIRVYLENGNDPETDEPGIGYFSCSLLRFADIRLKQRKLPKRYRN